MIENTYTCIVTVNMGHVLRGESLEILFTEEKKSLVKINYEERFIMDIKFLKLVSGEEIVAEIVKGDGVKVKNPVTFVPTESGAAMVPWMMMSDETTFDLAPIHVMWQGEPHPEIRSIYDQKYGSGLVIPQQEKKIIA